VSSCGFILAACSGTSAITDNIQVMALEVCSTSVATHWTLGLEVADLSTTMTAGAFLSPSES